MPPSAQAPQTRIAAGDQKPAQPPMRRLIRSPWFHLIAAFIMLGLIQGFVVKLYAVPSTSMQTTLRTGDRILVDRNAYVFETPQRGDIIVFTASDSWHQPRPNTDSVIETGLKWVGGLFGIGPGTEHTLVKRIIAVSGETVECCDTAGRVLINDEPLDEPYIYLDPPFSHGSFDCSSATISPRCFAPFTVPPGHYFVLGDQRGNSADSASDCRGKARDSGCRVATVRHSDFVGRAFAIVWPVTRWGGVG